MSGQPCLLLLLVCLVAAADEPVKLSDINEMHRKRVQVQDILLTMSERGVGFRMTASAQRKLKSWDFTDEDIEHVRGIMAGKKYVPPKDEPDAEAGDAGNAVTPKDFPIGHAHRSYIDVMAKVLSRRHRGQSRLPHADHRPGHAALLGEDVRRCAAA